MRIRISKDTNTASAADWKNKRGLRKKSTTTTKIVSFASHQGFPEGLHEGPHSSVEVRGAVGGRLRSDAEAQHAAGYSRRATHAVAQLLFRPQLVVKRLVHDLRLDKSVV